LWCTEQNEKYKGKIISTEDGSSTFVDALYGVTSYSIPGAATEIKHVYFLNGLGHVCELKQSRINNLEFGFGAGLNAALSFEVANKLSCEVTDTGIDKVALNLKLFYNFTVT
jgi:hypothetical protein